MIEIDLTINGHTMKNVYVTLEEGSIEDIVWIYRKEEHYLTFLLNDHAIYLNIKQQLEDYKANLEDEEGSDTQ